MVYAKPELEVIEFDEKALTDGIITSQEGVGEEATFRLNFR